MYAILLLTYWLISFFIIYAAISLGSISSPEDINNRRKFLLAEDIC